MEMSSIDERKGTAVLLVEDDEMIREAQEEMLKRNGHEVIAVDNGADAKKVFRKKFGQIDLVITDYNMPELSGGKLREFVKEVSEETPVMLVSGGVSALPREELEEFSRVLNKPFRMEDFLESADQLIQ